jgi:hypothetical protein
MVGTEPHLNGLDDSPAKVFLGFSRQRASILFSHARTLPRYPLNVTYIMLLLVSVIGARHRRMPA